MKLSDYLKAINHTKEPLLDTDDEFIEKGYVPFVVNRCLSYFPDTIFMVNQMNACPTVDKKMHFDYLLNSIRKRKRFSKWFKNEDWKIIKGYYCIFDVFSRTDIHIEISIPGTMKMYGYSEK